MKKVLAFVLTVFMIISVLAISIIADDVKKIDHRELGKYGQMHYYLPNAVSAADRPNSSDGKVTEGEYVLCSELTLPGSMDVLSFEDYKGYTDTEWVKIYLNRDSERLYLAIEVKDKVYYPNEDYFMINIGAKDGGTTLDGVSRVRYDFKGDATASVLSGDKVKTGSASFIKTPSGDWMSPTPAVKLAEHLGDRSLSWDSERGVLTLEAVFNIQAMLDYWGNSNSIEDARLYFFPIVNMGGASKAGGSDLVFQGRLCHYFSTAQDPAIKLAFTRDYPNISYWFGWAAEIIHFCEEPTPTTAPDTTPEDTNNDHQCTTTIAKTDYDPNVTVVVKVPIEDEIEQNGVNSVTSVSEAATSELGTSGGCGGYLSVSALAILPICLVSVLNKKKED